MENQMEKQVENEMETGAIKGRFRDPSLSINNLDWAQKVHG